jgi:glycosidase
MPGILLREETIAAADNVSITVVVSAQECLFRYRPAGPIESAQNVYAALSTQREIGAAVLPFAQHAEGSTVFLPFKADLLLSAEIRGADIVPFIRKWERWRWSEREQTQAFEMTKENGEFTFRIPHALVADTRTISFAIYAKDPNANNGWGWFWGCSDRTVESGLGDKYIPHYHELQLQSVIPSEVEGSRGKSPDVQRDPSTPLRSAQEDSEELARAAKKSSPFLTLRGRYSTAESRIRIYQLFVRLFGNTDETRKQNGTLAENGVGRFADINDTALKSIQQMGFSHIWLTGVLQQATGTDYSAIGRPADDADLLKGVAGSPYAIKDYFDLCPDYAEKPENRLEEFKALLDRVHRQGMKALIDFVPNHVARSYDSAMKPEWNFGAGDDRSKFFDPENNFFYLQLGSEQAPLRLPIRENAPLLSACDRRFQGEFDHCKVTGNNVASWAPSLVDWYETVKLNYGFDFTDPSRSTREYPSALAPDKALPDTWKKMDRVIEYWQGVGVDGFRCDMAHMVPPEFWNWLIHRARQRSAEVIFIAEAYDNDPTKVPGSDPIIARLNGEKGNVMFDLLNAGFNAVYDDPTYKTLKNIYDDQGWANDIDHSLGEPFIFDNSLRYAENHDEVRLAAASQWRGIGLAVGRPVAAILYGLSRGPAMLYNGQEVGEPAAEMEGFGGDDARTSIFDYWAMPEFVKWVNDHRYDGAHLSSEQKSLRAFYGRLINLVGEPAFRDGKFFPLNPANCDNPGFGRLPDEQASGHWLYAFLRYDPSTQQRFLIVANLHPNSALKNVRVLLPESALQFLDLSDQPARPKLKLIEWLSEESIDIRLSPKEAVSSGVPIAEIPPLSAFYFKFVL